MTTFKGVRVTREAVEAALQGFDADYPDPAAYHNWLNNNAYRYAVAYRGRLYPPKYILSGVTRVPTREFMGGAQTNAVFMELGFEIIALHETGARRLTYLLTWNPGRWNWSDLAKHAALVQSGAMVTDRWSCGNTKRIRRGDRLFLIKLGPEPRGIIGSGTALHTPEAGPHWDPARKGENALYVHLRFDYLVNPYTQPELMFPREALDASLYQPADRPMHWSPYASGVTIPPGVAAALEDAWHPHRSSQDRIPDEVEPGEGLPEGTKKTVAVNAYERNPRARAACLDYYGTACSVCGIDFGEVYGDVAAGYIHVHHLVPLSDIGEEYEVDPIRDLRPVCPNCHAVIHQRRPPHALAEVRQMLAIAAKAASRGDSS